MLKITCAQMKVVAGRPDLNTERMLKFIAFAKFREADMVVFPELCLSGNLVGDNLGKKSFLRDCEFFGEKIIEASQDIIVIFGNIGLHEEKISNMIFTAKDGVLISPPVVKKNLSYNEQKYFSRSSSTTSEINFEFGGKNYRINCIFDGDEPSGEFDFILKFSSKPFVVTNYLVKEKFSLTCPMICVGAVGIQNTGKTLYTFDGASRVYNSRGEIVQLAESFDETLNFVVLKEIDSLPVLKFAETSENTKIYAALHYGIRKFLRQIGVNKVVIGISGGIDSAVAAALYTKVLGAENVLLVNMPSVFNSATTRGLSEQLAKNLGCKYAVVPIQESVDFTVKQLESTPIIREEGKGTRDEEFIKISSFVRENIQARDRSGRILAALAAAVGGVFTCNANKAETTVGYATLYGDEAGFLCALADLWKFQVYNLARYLNEKIYRREVIPQGIIDIVPSAELSNAQNVDEGKGDPLKYPYHDFLFCAFVEAQVTPEEILSWYADGNLEENIGCEVGLVKKYFPTAKDFIEDLERWWKLFTGMAVAKRIQSPPILAVTNRAYGSFDESQNFSHLTQAYRNLREKLLSD